MAARDLEQYAQNQLAEELHGKSGTADELTREVEDIDDSFDFDSYAPYYSQHDDVIDELESEYSGEAEELTGGQTYAASDWQAAKSAYAAGLAYAAYGALFYQAKEAMKEAIEEIAELAEADGCEEPVISVTSSCVHGWAVHDREDEDGTMFWEPSELEGCKAISKEVNGVWLTVTWTPAKPE